MAVVIIGGAVLDVQAQPSSDDLQRGSSVVGHVAQLPGGVGRNIAEATHHLLHAPEDHGRQEQAVLFVSVVGRDAAADALLASFDHTGLSTQGVLRSRTAATPCVVALLDRGGEVAASVADVSAPATELTPAVIQQHAADIAAAQLLILDANLQQETLQAAVHLAAAAGVPVLFEPVSVPKARRCVPFLPSLAAITPNAHELLAIAAAVQQQQGLPALPRPAEGVPEHGSKSPQQLLAQLAPAAALVLQQGLSCIILTMGSMGAALLSLTDGQPGHPTPSSTVTQQSHHPQGQHSKRGMLSSAAYSLLQPHGRAASHARAHSPARLCVRAQHIPAAPAAVVNLSGAGDTLTGGFAAALVRGCAPQHALAVGIAAAHISVQCKLNVPRPQQGLVFEAVDHAGRQLLQQQQVWEFPVHSML